MVVSEFSGEMESEMETMMFSVRMVAKEKPSTLAKENKTRPLVANREGVLVLSKVKHPIRRKIKARKETWQSKRI